jgi:hypothetical protein
MGEMEVSRSKAEIDFPLERAHERNTQLTYV